MATSEQKKKLLKAKIAVALHDELGRVPKTEEIDQVFLLARVMYKAVLGLHYQRQQQKKDGQFRSSETTWSLKSITAPQIRRPRNTSSAAWGASQNTPTPKQRDRGVPLLLVSPNRAYPS
jgi:hypothetical protein